MAQYINEEGQQRYEDEKREENVSANFTSYTFSDVSANTNYTVKVTTPPIPILYNYILYNYILLYLQWCLCQH